MIRKMSGLRLGPAAENGIDGDQLRDVLKLTGVLGLLPPDPAGDKSAWPLFPGPLWRIEVLQIFLGHFARAVLIDV